MERKFLSTKFFNDDFRACSSNYDQKCSELMEKNKKDDKNAALASLSMFTLQWQLYFDFLYELVDEMERNHISKITDMKDRLIAFCHEPTIVSVLSYEEQWPFPSEITVKSRCILLRRKFVCDIVLMESGEDYLIAQAQFLEALYIVELIQLIMIHNGMLLRDWFAKKTDLSDWASVLIKYDVFQSFIPNKRWSNKKIRYAKEIYKELTFDNHK